MEITVTITDWDKHNPRKDVKRPSWFAFDNRMVEDDDLYEFSHAEFKAWIYILSKASQKQNCVVHINLGAAERKASISTSEFKSAIDKLIERNLVSIGEFYSDDSARIQKIDARQAVKSAIARGDLTRPSICEKCGESGDIEAHHQDYSKPLDIDWLCTKCHGRTRTNEFRTSTYATRTLQTDKTIQTRQDITPENGADTRSARFIAAYCERFKKRWDTNPVIKGKEAGIAKRLAKDLSPEKQELYLDAFFTMPDAWTIKAKHPLAIFETKLNEIVVFANTGQFSTSKQAQQADASATNLALLQKYGGKP